MKVLVLGNTGMLGRYVYKYLSLNDKFTVKGLGRPQLDATTITIDAAKEMLQSHKPDVVINCIGDIINREMNLDVLHAVQVNSVFPKVLDWATEELNIKFIHPTTDCVFTGKEGWYNEHDEHDVSDLYGRTKSLGEPTNATVIRTSIIGEEIGQSRSLIEWIKSQKNKTANGFINHQWNGITCLEFAKVCESIIENGSYWKGVRHMHSPDSVTKAELLELVNEIYDLNIEITETDGTTDCDRRLDSLYDLMYGDRKIPPLYNQIVELKEFYPNL